MGNELTGTIGTATSPAQGEGPNDQGINNPGLVATGTTNKAKRRAITDVHHLFNIYGDLQHARKSQNEKNGRIQAKLNSERPYNDAQLESEGLGYKSNFSTKPLSTTVGKVASRLTKSVQAARYLTSSELPDSIPDAKKKSEMFRHVSTDVIRKWDGWYNFINEVANEDSTFGWTTVAWLDNESWKPVHFRQDKTFLPDGTKQSVDSVQVVFFQQYLMPHELAFFIENRDAAETAGWDIGNTVEAINRAKPPSITGNGSAPYTEARRYEDAIRESSVSTSLQNGAKQINLVHCFATEIDGKISHYIGDADTKKILFEKLDRFDKVSDCLAVMSYEQAPTLMGSKGIGRDVYELAGILDRARNEVVDRLQLSGKIIVQGPENKITRFKLTVVGNVVIIPEGFTITQNKIESSVNDFIALDQQLTQLLDQIAGGVTPRRFEGERVTKAEVELFASREEEKRDDITTRYVIQKGNIISTIQRRMYRKDTGDEDAKEAREKLLRIMPEEELQMLAEQPALRTIEDYTQSDAQRIVLLAQESRNDPLYDHRKMERRKLSVLVNADFAEDVLLPENDPTVVAEQVRTQLLENQLLERGTEVPASPRDSHLIHINILKEGFKGTAESAASGDLPALQTSEVFLKHWEQHLTLAAQSGMDKQQVAQLTKELEETAKQIGELQAQVQQAAQAQMASVAPAGQPALAAAPSPALAPAPVAPAA
jgi:flagellar hook protein FlgE